MADDAWAPYGRFAHHVAVAMHCDLVEATDKIVEAIMADKVRLRYEGRVMRWAELVEAGHVELWPTDDGRRLPAPQVSFPRVELNRASVLRWLQPMQTKPIASGAKRGPKASYDWEEAWAFIVTAIYNDGVPKGQMAKRLADWFAETYDQQPAMSEIYRRVERAYRDIDISDN
jgi:hypothetical protein